MEVISREGTSYMVRQVRYQGEGQQGSNNTVRCDEERMLQCDGSSRDEVLRFHERGGVLAVSSAPDNCVQRSTSHESMHLPMFFS
jgi:hypothetical protein